VNECQEETAKDEQERKKRFRKTSTYGITKKLCGK